MINYLKNKILSLSPKEASFHHRGFTQVEKEVQDKLESVIRIFIEGYNNSISLKDTELVRALENKYEDHDLGFAFEGIGLYLGFHDLIFPARHSRLYRFTKEIAPNHDYIISVGAGFALARVPWALKVLDKYLKKLDPLLAWCLLDGLGFHQGIFKHKKFIERCSPIPQRLNPAFHQLFDAGLGRSIWWVKGADQERIKLAIDQFSEIRKEELWCGIGVACSYAGGTDINAANQLLVLAGEYAGHLKSGVPFACRMRQKGGNPSAWTSQLCNSWLGRSVDSAADWLMQTMYKALEEFPDDEKKGVRAYTKIREELTGSLLQNAPAV